MLFFLTCRCLVVNGKSLHVVFEKMHELLALLQSIKECMFMVA